MYESQFSALGNSLGVTLESDISVITLSDNINHTYCSKIKWEKDNALPISVAQLIMPYNEEISEYWIKYSGAVVIHANLNSHPNNNIASKITSSHGISLNLRKALGVDIYQDDNNKTHFKNDHYNYAFIGKVSRFKQVGKTFIIYLQDLGWKFLQKMPQEFRNNYIANQTLDNAFQAICDFIGVECAYSIEDLSQYNFASDGFSIEKDGQIVENVPSILSEWSNAINDENDKELTNDERNANALNDNQPFESSGLVEYKNKQKTSQQLNQSINQSINSAITNAPTQPTQTDNQEENTNINAKILQYQPEFDAKIKDLFIGNTFYNSNISDPVMNYEWISITPQASQSTSIENVSTDSNNE